MNIFLFGAPRIENRGNSVELGLRKSAALMAYLALSRQPYSREALATLFWPEDDHSTALGNLRRALYRINHALGCDFAIGTRKTIERNPELDLWVDVEDFLQNVSSPESQSLAQLAQAVDLYTADFMASISLPDSPGFDE